MNGSIHDQEFSQRCGTHAIYKYSDFVARLSGLIREDVSYHQFSQFIRGAHKALIDAGFSMTSHADCHFIFT
jgi:hypothetical protein